MFMFLSQLGGRQNSASLGSGGTRSGSIHCFPSLLRATVRFSAGPFPMLRSIQPLLSKTKTSTGLTAASAVRRLCQNEMMKEITETTIAKPDNVMLMSIVPRPKTIVSGPQADYSIYSCPFRLLIFPATMQQVHRIKSGYISTRTVAKVVSMELLPQQAVLLRG